MHNALWKTKDGAAVRVHLHIYIFFLKGKLFKRFKKKIFPV